MNAVRSHRRSPRTRLWTILAVAVVGATLTLSGCSSDADTPSATTSTASAVTTTASTPPSPSVPVAPPEQEPVEEAPTDDGLGNGAPAAPIATAPQAPDAPPANDNSGIDMSRCTNQIDYAGDPRSNAEINSIGERDGICPAPLPPVPAETPKCTDQINYAGDPRSNAEINSIGERDGICPAPQK